MVEKTASKQIDDMITHYSGWKGELLLKLRAIITKSGPNIIEEVKWKMATRPEGLPVWSQNGIICFAEIWKDNIKLLFPKGSKLKDSEKLFNARLKSKDIRAIELKEGDTIDQGTLERLVHEAIEANTKH